jgi:hypothetical protein
VKNTQTIVATEAPAAKPEVKAMPKRMKPLHDALMGAASTLSGSMRAFGIAAIAALDAGCHSFLKVEALPYLTQALTSQGIARASADASARIALVGWAAGADAIEGLPADGLRHLASVGKELPEADRKSAIVAALDSAKRNAAKPGKPSVSELRDAAGKGANVKPATAQLADLALKCAKGDHAKAIAFLRGAIEAVEAQQIESSEKPAKGDPTPEEIAARAAAVRKGKGQA